MTAMVVVIAVVVAADDGEVVVDTAGAAAIAVAVAAEPRDWSVFLCELVPLPTSRYCAQVFSNHPIKMKRLLQMEYLTSRSSTRALRDGHHWRC